MQSLSSDLSSVMMHRHRQCRSLVWVDIVEEVLHSRLHYWVLRFRSRLVLKGLLCMSSLAQRKREEALGYIRSLDPVTLSAATECKF